MCCGIGIVYKVSVLVVAIRQEPGLVGGGNASQLQMLMEMLLSPSEGLCDLTWWLSLSPTPILALNLVKIVVIDKRSTKIDERSCAGSQNVYLGRYS